MSVLERTDHSFTRRYHEGEGSFTAPWEPLSDLHVTDEVIIVEETVRVEQHEILPPNKVVEGIGWVMLSKMDLEEAGVHGLLAGVGNFEEAA